MKKTILISSKRKNQTTNLASKRPIQNAIETLDIEPLDEQNLVQEIKNQKSLKLMILVI